MGSLQISQFGIFAMLLIFVTGQFQQTRNCQYFKSGFKGDSDYNCIQEGLSISTEIDQKRILRFNCNRTSPDQLTEVAKNYSLLRDPSFIVEVAWFVRCPLPDQPLVWITTGSNQTKSPDSIRIEYSNLTDTLRSIHFIGFTGSKLNFVQNNITLLPDDLFEYAPNIERVILFGNRIDLSTKAFRKLTKMIYLDLNSNDIQELNEYVFENLHSLKMLNLWKNQIKSIHPKTFKDLIKLETIELSFNHLQELPEDVFSSTTSLKKVVIRKNQLKHLPRYLFNKTKNLEEIYLSNNQLTKFPEKFFSNLENLRNLSLNNNNLSSLPEDLFLNSNSIETIELQMNHLSILSNRTFTSMGKLKILNLSRNRIQDLPVTIFESLSALTKLDLSYNKIIKLDDNIFDNLYNLKILNLNHNVLTTIERAFRPFRELEELYLAYNNITYINTTLIIRSQLQNNVNLQILDLSHNHISQIYQDWTSLVWLKKLDLSYNDIEYVEAGDLYFLSADSIVDLSHNKITFIDMRLSSFIASQQNITWNAIYHPTRSVILGFNPIDCNCSIYYLLRDIEGSNFTPLVNLDVGNLQCANLNGTYVAEFKSEEMACEINNCPRFCGCRNRIDDQTLIVYCANQNLIAPPSFNSTLSYMRSIYKTFKVELDLTGNLLETFPDPNVMFGTKRINLTRLELSHNKIRTIDAEDILPSLQILHLDHNNLSKLDDKSINVLSNLSYLNQISLDHNPFECNCKIKNLLEFVQTHYRKIGNTSSPSCAPNGKHLAGKALISITIQELCPAENGPLITILITVVCVGALLIILIGLYFKFHEEIKLWLFVHEMCLWCFPKDYDMDKDKMYDAFISFSHKDDNFVLDDLVPGLEECERPFKLCVHYRDWIPGEFIPTQITNSVQSSRRTIIVLSKHFLQSEWSRIEFRTAHKQALTESRPRVIVILYGEIGPLEKLDNELRTYLSINTYVKWGDPWFWEKLRFALPHYEMPINKKQSEKFPRESFIENTTNDKKDLVKLVNKVAATTPPAANVLNPLDVITTQVQANKLLVAEQQGLQVKAV